jgi:hypothetical protein
MAWPIEEIPDEDSLYRRIHRVHLRHGDIDAAAFTNTKGDNRMSLDWAKYSTALQARDRARDPGANAIAVLEAGRVRGLPGQMVEHAPVEDNRAHSSITGEKTPRVRLELKRLCSLVIPMQDPG